MLLKSDLSECLRDIGLDKECERLATNGKNMMHTRWAYSMAGEEFARIHSWGHDPKRKVSLLSFKSGLSRS